MIFSPFFQNKRDRVCYDTFADRESGKEYVISKDGKPGPWCIKMREYLMGIQYGEIEDKFGWCTIVDC